VNNVFISLNDGNNIIQNEKTNIEKNNIIKTSLPEEVCDFGKLLNGTLKYTRINIIIRKIIIPIKGYNFVDVFKIGITLLVF
jgi:hypothetical protein